MRSLNKSRRTIGSGELAPLHICFGMLLDLGFCNMKHPVFIFYHSDSSFSPFFYCFYFLLVVLHGRLNWGLTVSSLYSRPWHFPLLSCLSPLLYPDCSLEIISPFQFLIIQPLLYLIHSGAKTRLLILPSPPKYSLSYMPDPTRGALDSSLGSEYPYYIDEKIQSSDNLINLLNLTHLMGNGTQMWSQVLYYDTPKHTLLCVTL